MNLNLKETFSIQIKMTSDWHIGAGAGRGNIDSLVQRDADDLPYIPAKTLTGILRDGCELVAQGLDDNEDNGIWQDWVNYIFGDQPALAGDVIESFPQPAALSIRSAHLSESLAKALMARPQVKNAITFIKPGIAIASESGCAGTNFLRFEEMVRTGTVLEAKGCQLILPAIADQNQKRTAYALLIAGAKMVERLGGKRRRGSGLCEISIEANPKSWLEWLSQQKSPPSFPKTPKEPENKKSQPANPTTHQDTTWYSLPLTITTQSPLIIPARTVGNVVETLDYIPGSYLLRILHQKLGDKINIGQAINSGDMIITNATVSIENQSGRPTPFCLFAEKLDGGLDKGRVYNRLVEDEPEGRQLKGIRGGYVGKLNMYKDFLPPYVKVETSIYTHNTIQDDLQRPTKEIGGIYSYEAISAGTIFQAELRLKKALIDQLNRNSKQWWTALKGTYRLGQSKKDDYGLIEMSSSSELKELPKQIALQNRTLYVWLLSDVLLRNDNLRPTTDPEDFRKQLEADLEVELTERKNNALIALMARQRRTDSWQVRWGLPRPSLVGLQAGSCMIYKVTGNIAPAKLIQVQIKGIGERCTEGYGQLCFNDPLLISPMSQLKPYPKSLEDSSEDKFYPLTNDPAFEYAQILETEAWREEIQRQALAEAADAYKRKNILGIEIQGEESKPSMSQLGALRSVISRLQSEEDSEKVISWIESRKEKWPADSIDNIKKLITEQAKVWTHLKIPDDLTITQDAKLRLKKELWAEAVRTLIDACIRTHKRDWEKAIKKLEEVKA